MKPGWSLPKKEKKQLAKRAKEEKKAQKFTAKKSQKAKKGKAKSQQKLSYRFRRFALKSAIIILLAFLFSVLSLSSAVYAYKDQFEGKAFFGTKIFGEDVGGKTLDEVQTVLNKKISGITFSFLVDNTEVTVKPDEAGVVFNSGNSARQALAKGKKGKWYQSWTYAFSSLLYKINPFAGEKVEPKLSENSEINYKINDEKLTSFTQSLSTKFNVESQNAGLVMTGADVQVIPAVYGRKIVSDSVKLQIIAAVKRGDSNKVKVEVEKVNPSIIEADTKEAINQAKNLISLPVTYYYKGQNFVPDKATIASWVIFNTQDVGGKQKLVPAIDAKRAYSYIYSLAGKINIPTINKKVSIENGSKQTVTQEGRDGLAVDVDRASVATADNLNAGKLVNLEIPTYVVKYKTQVNNIFVANWDKYIEINLSTQTLYAYTAGGNLVGSWRICSGKSGFATPTGTHLVLGKSSWIRMQGGWGTSEYYNLYPIKWATWFTGSGHAIHDAYWRSSFGYPASHGCINMPDDGAAFIYNWASVGTPVVVHY